MGIPQTETQLRNALKLDEYANQHTAPPLNTKMENVVELDGVAYTREAIDAALQAADDQTIRDILQYQHKILSHNNITGHGGAGGNLEIDRTHSNVRFSNNTRKN